MIFSCKANCDYFLTNFGYNFLKAVFLTQLPSKPILSSSRVVKYIPRQLFFCNITFATLKCHKKWNKCLQVQGHAPKAQPHQCKKGQTTQCVKIDQKCLILKLWGRIKHLRFSRNKLEFKSWTKILDSAKINMRHYWLIFSHCVSC